MLFGGCHRAPSVPTSAAHGLTLYYLLEARPWDVVCIRYVADALKKLSAPQPDEPSLFVTQAALLMTLNRPGLVPAALDLTNRAIAKDSKLAFGHAYHGWVLYRLNRVDEAWQHYRQA